MGSLLLFEVGGGSHKVQSDFTTLLVEAVTKVSLMSRAGDV